MRKSFLMARAMVNKAIAGDVQAFNSVADRLDGRVPHNVSSDGQEFSLLEMINHSYRLEAQRDAAAKAKVIEHKPMLDVPQAEKDQSE